MKRRSLALFVTAGAIVVMAARPALATNYTAVHGTSGDDRIVAGPQPQEIHGNGGDDLLAGGKSPDILWGGSGNDRLHNSDSGQVGQLLDGGPGFDICTGDKHDTFISCEVVKFH